MHEVVINFRLKCTFQLELYQFLFVYIIYIKGANSESEVL